jgi:restriction endonuclease Mrr
LFWARLLRNGYAGRRLYRLCKQRHLADVSVDVQAVRFPSLTLMRYFIHMDRIEQAALDAGAVTQEELARFRASLEQANATESFFCTANQMTVIGRKNLIGQSSS